MTDMTPLSEETYPGDIEIEPRRFQHRLTKTVCVITTQQGLDHCLGSQYWEEVFDPGAAA